MQNTKASTKSTKIHSGDCDVEAALDDGELEGPDLSPSKTQAPEEGEKIRKLNDGGKQTMPAVRRSTRGGRSRNSSIALEVDLDELDVSDLDKSEESLGHDIYVEPKPKSAKAT